MRNVRFAFIDRLSLFMLFTRLSQSAHDSTLDRRRSIIVTSRYITPPGPDLQGAIPIRDLDPAEVVHDPIRVVDGCSRGRFAGQRTRNGADGCRPRSSGIGDNVERDRNASPGGESGDRADEHRWAPAGSRSCATNPG
jgi:hypothetical protein